MSLGKSLLGMFVEIDESEVASTTPAAPAPGAGAPVVHPSSASSSATAPAARGGATPDEAIIAKLKQALQDNNRPGLDFLEFQASLAALEKVIPDEPTRYRSAFATMATMGVTVSVLLETAQFYREVLKKETAEFEREMQLRQKNGVGDKQSEIDGLKKSIQAASESIQRLTAEIAASQAKMTKLQGQIEDANGKLASARQRFESSVQQVDAEILQQQKQIQNLLGQGA